MLFRPLDTETLDKWISLSILGLLERFIYVADIGAFLTVLVLDGYLSVHVFFLSDQS